ncbi:hypothetical protein [Streptomyces sp. NPDC001978]|uniref:hypothetical protein n=1 Tax=Streptomyces sp. NPDC001978 TaxID=3364627 RepID=UPI0036B06888
MRSSKDPFEITTAYDYNDLGQQTKNTLTSAGGSSQRTMTWDFYPCGARKVIAAGEGGNVASAGTISA